MEDYTARFEEVCKKTFTEQAKHFLRQFVLDFGGDKFEAVLDISEEFRSYAPDGQKDTTGSIEEFKAHLFLEKRGETLTVKELRDYLKQVHFAPHHPVALIEYLMWKYQKHAPDLFAPPPQGGVPPHLMQALNEAIEAYLSSKRAQREREEEMKRLEEQAKGKRSVASVQASNKKDELAGQEFAQKFQELQALKKKKAAQKAVDEAEKIDPFVAEQQRLAEEKQRREEEERKKKEESRARLKAKASLWQ